MLEVGGKVRSCNHSLLSPMNSAVQRSEKLSSLYFKPKQKGNMQRLCTFVCSKVHVFLYYFPSVIEKLNECLGLVGLLKRLE